MDSTDIPLRPRRMGYTHRCVHTSGTPTYFPLFLQRSVWALWRFLYHWVLYNTSVFFLECCNWTLRQSRSHPCTILHVRTECRPIFLRHRTLRFRMNFPPDTTLAVRPSAVILPLSELFLPSTSLMLPFLTSFKCSHKWYSNDFRTRNTVHSAAIFSQILSFLQDTSCNITYGIPGPQRPYSKEFLMWHIQSLVPHSPP